VSGIAGILYFDGREPAPGLLKKMANRLAHRGVDGSRVWSAGSAGLIHCLFATTPESISSRQPLVSAAGNLVITADARIDNRQELAGLLGLQWGQMQNPDEYFILKAYEKWGQACASRLLGDFAFAIWDKDQNRLFCARDSLGVKPFYYHASSSLFIFASEIKAILALDEVPCELNELCLLDFLLDDRQDKKITFFQGISRLPPAHFLSVRSGQFRMEPYWELDPTREVHFNHDEEYAERFQELFIQAIRARLHSALPVACALSGGLDSSSIACIARDLLSESGGKPLSTYSAIFSGLSERELALIDERKFIDRVLSTGRFQPYSVDMGLIGPLTNLEGLLRMIDEPISAPTLSIFLELYQAASLHGVGVYLEGIDGDLVLSHGYERLFDLAHQFKWATWLRELREASSKSGLSQYEIAKRYTLRYMIPPPIYQWMSSSRRLPGNILPYLSAAFTHQKSIKDRIDDFNRRKNTLPRSAARVHFQDLSSGAVPLSLELLDKIASQYKVEIRYPFYDRRLVEYCLAVPAEQKFSMGWSRYMFRNSLAGILPEEIRWRCNKADFRPFFISGMIKFSGPFLKDMLSGNLAQLEPYLHTDRLRALTQRFTSGEPCSTGEVEILYRVAMLLKWIESSQSKFQRNVSVSLKEKPLDLNTKTC
jgi:asparagine synthase (glutamine-hydrolysing)